MEVDKVLHPLVVVGLKGSEDVRISNDNWSLLLTKVSKCEEDKLQRSLILRSLPTNKVCAFS